MKRPSTIESLSKITPQKLYHGLFTQGFFGDQLPDVFDLEAFSNRSNRRFIRENDGLQEYEMSNMAGHSKRYQIPNPFLYDQLCRFLSNHWPDLLRYFSQVTEGQTYPVSREFPVIDTKGDFVYPVHLKNTDGMDLIPLKVGKRLEIKTDISSFHSTIDIEKIQKALQETDQRNWVNKLTLFSEKDPFGRLPGLLNGPAAYRLLEEILFSRIDEKLVKKGYIFIRAGDDYTCFARNEKQAHDFIRDLSGILYSYGLELNEVKTEITRYPVTFLPSWKETLASEFEGLKNKQISDPEVLFSIYDLCVQNYWNSGQDTGIFREFILRLAKMDLDSKIVSALVQLSLHMAFLFPALIADIEKSLFRFFDPAQKERWITRLFKQALLEENSELIIWSLYLADRFDLWLRSLDLFDLLQLDNALINFYLLVYLQGRKDEEGVSFLKEEAYRWIERKSFDENWLFLYHLLEEEDLPDPWQGIKREGITFIKPRKRRLYEKSGE